MTYPIAKNLLVSMIIEGPHWKQWIFFPWRNFEYFSSKEKPKDECLLRRVIAKCSILNQIWLKICLTK
jgi:hypothetical protein